MIGRFLILIISIWFTACMGAGRTVNQSRYPSASINSMNAMRKAIVSIHTTKNEAALTFEGRIIKRVGRCTGVVVSSDGLILTAKHCLENRDLKTSVKVKYMGKKLPAKILDQSLFYDLAVLSIGGSDRHFLNLCSKVAPGDRVYVFGFPEKSATVLYAEVKVSADGFLTSDAATKLGYSGGPAIEEREECVAGISYFHYESYTHLGEKSRHVGLDILHKILGGITK